MALTETWLSPDVSKNASVVQECADYGYKLFHIPRPTRRGGGVGILVKDNISIVGNTIEHLAHTTFEHIELLITSISIHIRLVVVYRPHQSKINKNTKVQFIEVILWRSCRHAAVDCYSVEISTLIGWIRKTRVKIF